MSDIAFSSEVFNMFKDQFEQQVATLEIMVLKLESVDEYEEVVNELFRLFHSYKATSSYLKLSNLHLLTVKSEAVLGMLLQESGPASYDIVEWLLKVSDQFSIWSDELELGLTTLSDAPENLISEITLTKPETSPAKRMKELTLLYFDTKKERALRILPALEKIIYEVNNVATIEQLKQMKTDPNIIFTNLGKDTFKIIKSLKRKFPDSAIIIAIDSVTQDIKLKLGLHGINHIIANPIKGEALKRELYAVTNSHFSERRILITNKKIRAFINTLQPLPGTLMKIQEICDDPEMSVGDLTKVVKTDPIIMGTILNATNSPIYGLKRISTIDHAVSTFGKRTVKAIALSEMSKYIGDINLDTYQIDAKTFSKVSNLRLSLMIKWFSKVSISDLSILSATAILGNIGQLLISKEIQKLEHVEEFQKILNSDSSQKAEEKILHTTTPYVSSDILAYWKLQPEIVDSIRYSDEPKNAPIELKALCIANHVIYRLIDIDGTIAPRVYDELTILVAEEKLNPEALQNALAFIHTLDS